MTIFDHIQTLAFTKRKGKDLNVEDLNQFNVYMMNRWLSFYSPAICSFINETLNNMHISSFTTLDQYNFYFSVFPKIKFKRLSYVKKDKKEDVSEKNKLPCFMSEREFKQNEQFSKILEKS